MKSALTLFYLFFSAALLQGQPDVKTKKYPSLLWEISGKGMKKPSFLIGTMHVSSKLAFNLPDSFYMAVRNAEVVALETNPETWQEDMNKYDLSGDAENNSLYGNYSSVPSDYFNISTLKFYKYDKKIERALYSNPSAINNLLYRSYGNESSDFEEDTYLDMYIFQCGKKWNKKVAGVEDYGESMRLMAEAYKDAAKDKTKKERSYGDWDEAYSSDKLQDAYRRGNLDLLDSINKYNSFSTAFDEKFLYKRNEIQASSIDSILKTGSTLLVGVGAAHLPGDRGVIEMLRQKGYKLRPVKMGERASREKDLVDKIRVPVVFRTEMADDGLFKVDIPGKWYKFGEDASLDQKQCADMANGSYYLVTRIMTNAWMWSHTTDDVVRVVDSLLYENVPGKIISKLTISRNGYKGFDVVNRTRRGDLQRYHIFITPFEIIFFKMSGNGDYVKNGPEAEKFFGSIKFREYKNGDGNPAAAWKKYSPPFGGFSVELPHEPYTGNDGSWIFDATDKVSGTNLRVIRTDIHNFHFVEEDSFDLSLMNESFMASDFIDTPLLLRHTHYKGYPALEGKYRDKTGGLYHTRFILRGPHYYTLIARGKEESPAVQQFLNSFEIKPFIYGNARLQKDTSLYFSVTTTYYPENKKIKLDIPRYTWSTYGDEEEVGTEEDLLEGGAYRNKIISNDSTGEKIFVSFFRSSRYQYQKDSSALEKDSQSSFFADTSYIYRLKKKTELANKTRIWETIVSDTGSSRTLRTKIFYKDGTGFTLAVQSDTLSEPGDFVKSFFETFTPADTLKGINPFTKKSKIFFEDFHSADSVLHNRAIKHISDIDLDSSDFIPLKKAIASLNWNEKKYLETKKEFINKLGGIKNREAADYLKQQYDALDDTVELQYAVLENLLQHQTQYAYTLFGRIISSEPPVLAFGDVDYSAFNTGLLGKYLSGYQFKDGKFLDELSDSLKLTRSILSDLLPLLNLDDYKETMMNLLRDMIDSSLVQPKDYEAYFSKFLIEAKQELKKQSIAEKKRAIAKAEEIREDNKKPSYLSDTDKADDGNEDLSLYACLLLPFGDLNPAVDPVIQQMLRSGDKRLKYNTLLLLVGKNKPFPDTLLHYFAGMDEYRYELYSDLKEIKKLSLFPEKFNTHVQLGQSALLGEKAYDKPDTLVYLQRMPATVKGKKGFVYFYKYKSKKDDLLWKLATVGLVPEDPGKFEFEDNTTSRSFFTGVPSVWAALPRPYDFTALSDTKIKDDEPLDRQLDRALKKLLYSRRKSAKEFYKNDDMDTEPAEY